MLTHVDGIKFCARAVFSKVLYVQLFTLLFFGGLILSRSSAATTATGDVTPQPITQYSFLTVGYQDIGTLQIDGGSALASSSVMIAQSPTAIGAATVTGVGTNWSTGTMTVGGNGLGRLTVSNGAVVSVNSSGLNIGQDNSSNGAATVQDAGTVLQVNGSLRIGNSGVGLLRIADNAIVNVPNNSTQIGAQFGNTVSGLNRLELANGVLRTGNLTNYGVVTGSGELDVFSNNDMQNYGSIVSSGGRLVVAGNSSGLLQNNGIISAAGSELEFGRFVSNTNANGMAAQVTLRDGTIRFPLLNNNQYSLGNDGVLAATGGTDDVYGRINNTTNGTIAATNHSVLTFHHNVVASGGTISVFPGSTAIFLQNLTMSGGALLLADLAGTNDATGFGRVEVVGNTQLGGASLAVTLSDGFTPKLGDTFPLVASTGAISGAPTLGQMPGLPTGLVWHLNIGANLVSLSVIPTISGDYNNNGVVDAADYAVWRATLGQTGTGLAADGNHNNLIDASDYEVWTGNFGLVADGPGAAATAATEVPEPCALLLCLFGLALLTNSSWLRDVC